MTYKNWKIFKLGDLCEFSSEKIETKYISNKNYISTENMLPNKQGVTIASSLPKTKKVNKFEKDDVLISNIRPYFKKIWFANMNGGASNDVLILKNKNKEILDNQYLFYFLSTDHFFNYVTSSAKGTKMPRGDKTAIMKYEILLPPIEDQKKIAAILSTIDKKIKINNKINKTIANIANTIFKYWFIDFEFPNENGEPYKSSGGEMVESELGLIPRDWEIRKLGDIIQLYDSLRVPLSKREREKREKIYPYYGATSIMDYVDDYIFNGIYVLMGEDGTVTDEQGYPILQYVWGKFWVNNHAHVIKGKDGFSDEFIYLLLKNTNVSAIVTGAVQKKINQTNLKNLKVKLPENNEIIKQFTMITDKLFCLYRNLSEQNIKLTRIRDLLLPKLTSGEIRVPIENQ